MSIDSWLDDAHIRESELAAMLAGRPIKLAKEPKNRWLLFVGDQALIQPPDGWAWEIIGIQVYGGTVPAADIIGSLDITQPNIVPGGDISNWYYETPLITAAAGGAFAWNIAPGLSHAAFTGGTLPIIVSPCPRFIYGGWTATLSVQGAGVWHEATLLYREHEVQY